jgi:hypothetical protein
MIVLGASLGGGRSRSIEEELTNIVRNRSELTGEYPPFAQKWVPPTLSSEALLNEKSPKLPQKGKNHKKREKIATKECPK